ncbi:Bug family tripartite tricarboxylate transporter substrate binding protein [Aureimonas mangrovi]|uniref:Bug family tripartite tricarboxylate transporter substrate binding protein n=1 Tax=Aureimonas mangrovi TaxID=2758041 RepID=UPI00163D99EC|nr:tripartite tricarboxylate transporter substrate binding protein [Aureimonas mangrovi]
MPKLLIAALTTLALLLPGAALAQGTYPEQTITLVVPFPPGGTLDTAARLIASELEGSLGQTVLIDNRSGAGGNIGADVVAKAEPDGYTLLMGALSTHAVNVSLYPDIPFDPIADFTPITLVATTPNVLVLNRDVPATNLAEFLELARAEPDGFAFASGSSGSAGHLAGELLNEVAGIQTVHVPYRGSAQAMQAVLAGEVQFIFDNLASASSHIDAGVVTPLAVTTAERSPFQPDLPTMAEAGVEGFDLTTWFGILAPAGTPEPIVETLNGAIRDALATPRLTQALAAQGTEAAPSTPQEFADFISAEIEKYAAIIQNANITLE